MIRHNALGAALVLLLLAGRPVAAEDAPLGPIVDLDRSADFAEPREPLRSPRPAPPHTSVQLELVVDKTGIVRSARPIAGPEDLYDASVAAALSWRFIPTVRDGAPVAVRFVSHLLIIPPEILPATHLPFPEVDDLSGVSISILNTGCWGPCPTFRVEIAGTGLVHFHGDAPIAADLDYRVPTEKVAALVDAFRDANFFSLRDAYEVEMTDVPTVTTTITVGGRTKSIYDNQGWMMGMPEALSRLEAEIVKTAMVPDLIGCGEPAVALLRAAAIDFSRAANLLAGTVNCEDGTLFRTLLEAGAPLTGGTGGWRGTLDEMAFRDDDRRSAVISAALERPNAEDRAVGLRLAIRAGDAALVRTLAEGPYGIAAIDGRDADGATPLLVAASLGSADMVRLLLELGAAAQARDFKGSTALHVAASGDVVRVLLAAGLDPDTLDGAAVAQSMGRTPLATARSADVALALIAGGADIEKRNWFERTPIMEAEGEVVPVLIDAGADVSARDRWGATPLHFASTRIAIEALIAAGADPDARDDQGLTPILTAVDDAQSLADVRDAGTRIVELIAAGADPAAWSGIGQIRDVARAFGWYDVIDALDQQGSVTGP